MVKYGTKFHISDGNFCVLINILRAACAKMILLNDIFYMINRDNAPAHTPVKYELILNVASLTGSLL